MLTNEDGTAQSASCFRSLGRREPVFARGPHGHWQTSILLVVLRCDQLNDPCVIDGSINGLTFHAHVEQILVPTLLRGDNVIIYNLGVHKGKAVSMYT